VSFEHLPVKSHRLQEISKVKNHGITGHFSDLSSNKPQHLKLYKGFPSRHIHLALQQDASVYLRLNHYSSAYTYKINFMLDFQARSEDSNWSVSWLLKMQISGFKLSGLTKSQDPAWEDRHI
jgi:hypothetical protein